MDFIYKAKTKDGREQTGTVAASNRDEAVKALNDSGLFIISLEKKEKKSIWEKSISFKRITPKEVAIFCRQFAVMIKADVSIVSALQSLSKQVSNEKFADIIKEVGSRVEEGSSLSAALDKFPKVFDSFFVNVIRSGEASGRMGEALEYLADHLERENRLVSQVKGAMMYPAFILIVFVLAFILIMTFVIPKLLTALTKFDQDLPTMTKVIISVSEFFTSSGGIFAGIALIGMGVGVYFWIQKTEAGRNFFDRFKINMPGVLGELMKKFYLTRFAENFAVLVKAGLPIAEALKISGNIVGNKVYKRALHATQKKVVRGVKISDSLENHPHLFPGFVTQMIRVGENTGHLNETLEKIVDFYQQEVDTAVKSLSSIIEPILIVMMGVMVGILVIGVFLPIFTVQMGALNA